MTTMSLAAPTPADTGAAPGLWPRVTYLLAGLPLGTAAFVVAVAGSSVGVSTLVLWIGIPILAATLWASRGLATVERRSTERVTGRALPPHHDHRRVLAVLAWFGLGAGRGTV